MSLRWSHFQSLWIPLLATNAILAASDDWSQLKELPGGEVRVHQRLNATSVAGTIDRVTEEFLVINNKSGQTAIERADVLRVEWRPAERHRLLPGMNRRRQDPTLPKDQLDLRPNRDWIGSLKINPKTGYKTVYSVDAKP